MQDSNDKYEALLKEHKEFVYIVSHDLSAPVRLIEGFISILFDELGNELTDNQKKYQENIQGAILDIKSKIADLYEWSNISPERQKNENIILDDIVSNCVVLLKQEIEEARATVHVKSLPDVLGDRQMLERFFYCLIDNAIKFHAKSRPPEINIFCEDKAGVKTVVVQDNGIGIPASEVEHSMRIFKALQHHDEYTGKGTGLAFAKKIADLHGWGLSIEANQNGVGTRVVVALNKNSNVKSIDNRNFRILLVDDSAPDVILFKHACRSFKNLDIMNVRSVREALNALKQDGFDMAFIDLNLTDSMGPASIKEIKKSFQSLPIVAVTGIASSITIEECIIAGARSVLLKSDLGESVIAACLREAGYELLKK